MRTYTKNPSEAFAQEITAGLVIASPFTKDDGTSQVTWAVDSIEPAADGNLRFHVSSPRTGKSPHAILFGADGIVKVTGTVQGTIAAPKTRTPAGKATAKNPAPVKVTKMAPKGTARTEKARQAAAQVAALTAEVSKLPEVPAVKYDRVIGEYVNPTAVAAVLHSIANLLEGK